MSRLIAEGFGLGRAPVAPGTVASAAAVLVGAGLLRLPEPWSVPALTVAIFLASFGGVAAIRRAGIAGDPGSVVIDEIAGQWVALLALPGPGPWWLLAAFALFRLFDIAKPGPVGWADRHPGAEGVNAQGVNAQGVNAQGVNAQGVNAQGVNAWGVMGDDLIAGALAALVLAAARVALGWF